MIPKVKLHYVHFPTHWGKIQDPRDFENPYISSRGLDALLIIKTIVKAAEIFKKDALGIGIINCLLDGK